MDKAQSIEELQFFISRMLKSKTVCIKNEVVYFTTTKKIGIAAKTAIENNYANVDVCIEFQYSNIGVRYSAKINNSKLNKAAEIGIVKIMAAKHGTIFGYKSDSMQVKDGLIKVDPWFLDKESFDYLIEIGFTIAEL
jgi:hypothetical protein